MKRANRPNRVHRRTPTGSTDGAGGACRLGVTVDAVDAVARASVGTRLRGTRAPRHLQPASAEGVVAVAARAWRLAAHGVLVVSCAVGASSGAPAVALAADGAASAASFATVEVDEPRAFGYTVGDVVERRLVLRLPASLALDPASLPHAGTRGKALELRSLERHESRDAGGGRRLDIRLAYQVFASPREVRTLELPSLSLRIETPPGEPPQSLRVDAWPLTVGPLAALEPSPRRGLGELRPDAPPPAIDTASVRQAAVALGVAAALLAAYLGHVYLALPWWAARRRPLTAASRQIGRLTPEAEPQALEALHAALNATAGEVLFARGLPAFVASQPRYAPLADDLRRFFERSGAVFFGAAAGIVVAAAPAGMATAAPAGRTAAAPAGAAAAPTGAATEPMRWLQQLARRLGEAERGTA